MAEGGKILLVDDEPANLLALEAVLEDLGHPLVRAHSGREALRQLMSGDFSVILMDVQMPGMDGFETARLIRSRERSKDTPIIFLTAVGRSENEMFRGYQVGAVDYLIKPFIPEILRYKVAVLMDLQSKARALQEANATLEQRVRERTLALEAQGRLLSRSNEELEQFAYAASHDLQEPLRSMTSYLYFLERSLGPNLTAEAQRHMDLAVESAKRMRQLIRGLLAFSKADAASQERQSVDCGHLLNGVLSLLEDGIKASGARIEVAGGLPTVQGDPATLSQLFQNLLANALKFTHDRPQVELGAKCEGNEALFWVRDHGIGIASQDQAQLFRLFKRLHTREEFPGNGLGLALCRKIVERHGGRLWLESAPGKGSTFYFTLPSEAANADRDTERTAAL